MATVQRVTMPAQCPRCQGPVYQDYDGDYCCLLCGECVYAIAPPVRWEDLAPDGEPARRRRGRPRKQPVAAA